MRRTLFRFAIICVILSSRATTQSQQTNEGLKPNAEVLISSEGRSRVNEPLKITLQVENVGKIPFYVTPAVQVFNYLGGFEVVVVAPTGASVRGGAAAGDFAGRIDIMEDAKRFVLLAPGAMYGGTIATLTVPMSPGTYRVVGKRIPLLVSESAKEKLRSGLPFPVLLDLVESKPIAVTVTE